MPVVQDVLCEDLIHVRSMHGYKSRTREAEECTISQAGLSNI